MKMLSVIVPVHNAEKWLSQTLDSLTAQTYQPMEVICVDDGSTDGSSEIINSYMERHSQLRLIHQENAGVSIARNRGIEEAKGDYIAFLDADDYVDHDMYEKMIVKLEAERSDIVFCEFVRFWPNGKLQYTHESSFAKLVENPGDIRHFLYSTPSRREGDHLYTEDIHGSVWRSVFVREKVFNHAIRFVPGLIFAEDQVFMLNYLQHCDSISYCPEAFVHYRGWTKERQYHDFYRNHLLLAQEQRKIVGGSAYYSQRQKRQLINYLDCSAYFAIAKEVFEYRPDCVEIMRRYTANPDFRRMLTLSGFLQKYRLRREPNRIALFILLKLRLWSVVKRFYPYKRY